MLHALHCPTCVDAEETCIQRAPHTVPARSLCHLTPTTRHSPLAPDRPEAECQVGEHGADEAGPVEAQLTRRGQAHTSHDGDQAQDDRQRGRLTKDHPGVVVVVIVKVVVVVGTNCTTPGWGGSSMVGWWHVLIGWHASEAWEERSCCCFGMNDTAT